MPMMREASSVHDHGPSPGGSTLQFEGPLDNLQLQPCPAPPKTRTLLPVAILWVLAHEVRLRYRCSGHCVSHLGA